MKALIIGAAGFVGKYLIEHLTSLNWNITATRLPNETISSEVEWLELDILDYDAISSVLRFVKPDCLFHLAAQSSVALSWKKPSFTVDVNIKGVIHLLEAARLLSNIPRILLIGSGEEYGYVLPSDLPIREDTKLKPGNIYAITKAAQGMLGQMYARAYGINIIIARAFNHIGPGQPDAFVVSNFCRQVAEMEAGVKQPVLYTGDISAKRDFTDVHDVVRAYVLLIQRGIAGEIYNVGSGRAISIKDILDIILSYAKIQISIEKDSSRLRPAETPIVKADITRLENATGWRPEIPIERTIKDTLEYWREKVRQDEEILAYENV